MYRACELLYSVELNVDAREKGGELYCLRCHDKMGIPICGACRSAAVLTDSLCYSFIFRLFSIHQHF